MCVGKSPFTAPAGWHSLPPAPWCATSACRAAPISVSPRGCCSDTSTIGRRCVASSIWLIECPKSILASKPSLHTPFATGAFATRGWDACCVLPSMPGCAVDAGRWPNLILLSGCACRQSPNFIKKERPQLLRSLLFCLVATRCWLSGAGVGKHAAHASHHIRKKPSHTKRLFLWCHQESNRGHKDFQSFALPTELWHQVCKSETRKWWCHQESNRGHKDFQSFALPTELWHRAGV